MDIQAFEFQAFMLRTAFTEKVYQGVSLEIYPELAETISKLTINSLKGVSREKKKYKPECHKSLK